MYIAFDHIVLGTTDMEACCAVLAREGLAVVQRNDVLSPSDPQLNRFVVLPDGSYVQVFGLREAGAAHKWGPRLAAGGGWIDYALWTDDAQADAVQLQRAGVDLSGPYDATRTLADGRSWAARVLDTAPQGELHVLPFFVQDLAEREIRVPPGFPPGPTAAAIVGVVLAVPEITVAAEVMRKTLGGQSGVMLSVASGACEIGFGGRWIRIVEDRTASGVMSIREVTIGRIGETRPGAGRLAVPAATAGARLLIDL